MKHLNTNTVNLLCVSLDKTSIDVFKQCSQFLSILVEYEYFKTITINCLNIKKRIIINFINKYNPLLNLINIDDLAIQQFKNFNIKYIQLSKYQTRNQKSNYSLDHVIKLLLPKLQTLEISLYVHYNKNYY